MSVKYKSVKLESSLKCFGLDRGVSGGSTMMVEFDLDEDLDPKEANRIILAEKEKLDVMVCTMELAAGDMSIDQYKGRRQHIKSTYDRVLKRTDEA